ncbi:serine-rich adhesin for platelets-like [Watersipora subatra]|uniref:serine-rich adhesin for platelets-like n=1 Tax=Watersipora subatra TaxID=2589382 RepID=UPI00355C9958
MKFCQICSRRPKGRKPTAIKRCLECNKQLCKRCVAQHQETRVTQNHTLCSLDNAQKLMCSEHEESVRFICKTCSKCVCVYCTHTSHRGHDIMSVGDGMQVCQQQMDTTIDTCNRRVDSLTSQLHSIQGWELCYNETKELIQTTAAAFQMQVENQKQLTLAKLDELYGTEVLDMINKKDQLTESLQGLTEACKFDQVTPDETVSLEAILIQNEIQNKVKNLLSETSMSASNSLPPPELTISFEKGGLSLGALIATQEDANEPQYYDADETEDSLAASQNWCRSCRSRSRSRSRGADLSKRLQGILNPVMSDTDVSLTDVSALGTLSPQFSKYNFSDTDELGEAEMQSDRNSHQPSKELDYENMEMMLSTVPDVVPSTRQTEETGTQYEIITTSPNSQYSNMTSQTEALRPMVLTQDAECQYESIETKTEKQFNSFSTMTSLKFNLSQNSMPFAEDTDTGHHFQLVPFTNKSEQMTMTTQLLQTSDQSTTTSPHRYTHKATSISVEQKDVSLNPIGWQLKNNSSQTIGEHVKEAMTNTEALNVVKDVETNTDVSTQSEKFSQTIVQKVLACGVMAKPSIAEFSINVKPTSHNSATNTGVQETTDGSAQTTRQDHVQKSTNTPCSLSVSTGVSAYVVGVNNQTSTKDLFQLNEVGMQTESTTSSSNKSVGCEAKVSSLDNFTNTDQASHKTVASGTDVPNIPLVSTAVGTTPLPILRNKGVNVTQSKCDAWTSTMKKNTSSKACGTERVRLRNVGLYVRPLSVNSSSMTEPVVSKDASCGPEEAKLQSHQQLDTKGLINYFNRQTNTQTPTKTEMRTKHSQTRVITLSDNYTAMFPSVSVDKSTNTPHQIRQQLRGHFELSNASTQLQSRAVQTEWAAHECPSCLPTMDVGPLGMKMMPEANGSMLTMDNNHRHLRLAPPQNSLLGIKKRQHSLPAQLAPAMCDKFTNTGSLSTLLHPDKSSTDCMDNKISECILKLRQVTKKLQKSSNDVTRSENFIYTPASGNLGALSPSHPPAESVTPLSRSDTVISGATSPWEWQDDSSESSAPTTNMTDRTANLSESYSPRSFMDPEVRSRLRRLGSSTQSDDVFVPYEQESLPVQSSALPGRSQSPSQTARSGSLGHQWDLKSLVLEEDRLRRRLGNSNEQLNTLGVEKAEGHQMLPIGSKIHKSTENLITSKDSAHLLPVPNLPTTPQSKVKSGKQRTKARSRQLPAVDMLGVHRKGEAEPKQSSTKTSPMSKQQLKTPSPSAEHSGTSMKTSAHTIISSPHLNTPYISSTNLVLDPESKPLKAVKQPRSQRGNTTVRRFFHIEPVFSPVQTPQRVPVTGSETRLSTAQPSSSKDSTASSPIKVGPVKHSPLVATHNKSTHDGKPSAQKKKKLPFRKPWS